MNRRYMLAGGIMVAIVVLLLVAHRRCPACQEQWSRWRSSLGL